MLFLPKRQFSTYFTVCSFDFLAFLLTFVEDEDSFGLKTFDISLPLPLLLTPLAMLAKEMVDSPFNLRVVVKNVLTVFLNIANLLIRVRNNPVLSIGVYLPCPGIIL